MLLLCIWGFPGGSAVKNSPASAGDADVGWIPGREDPWRRNWQPSPVFLPGKSHGQQSLTGYSPWGCKELDTTEQQQCNNKSVFAKIHGPKSLESLMIFS